jgi:hypothetical protein
MSYHTGTMTSLFACARSRGVDTCDARPVVDQVIYDSSYWSSYTAAVLQAAASAARYKSTVAERCGCSLSL